MRVYEVLLKRAGVLAAVLGLMLMLAGCGGTDATPTTGVSTPASTVGTGIGTSSGTASISGVATTVPTAMTVNGTVTTGMAGNTTPSAGATTGASSSQPGATPVSDWKPGGHAKSITAPSKVVGGGTFTIGSDASYPPQEYIGGDNKAVGLDIDVAAEIASRMGLDLKVVNFKFDDIIPALNAGQFDAVLSAMTITDDRKKAVNFVPYFDAGQAVLVRKGNPKGVKALEDLSGLNAAAESGTTEEMTLKDLNDRLSKAGKAKVNILTYPTDTEAVDQLRVGRADATLHDSPVAAYYSKLNPDFEVAIADFQSAPEGIAVAQNNKEMFDAINSAVDAMKKDGTLDAIKAKWGVK